VIKLDINIDKNKILKKITIQGHSNFSKKGNDIVCSAVSILYYSAYLSFNNIDGVVYNYQDNGKEALLELINYKENIEGELRGITIYLLTGIKALYRDYKDYLKIKIIEN